MPKISVKEQSEKQKSNVILDYLLRKYGSVSRSELLERLPPKMLLDRKMKVGEELRSPHCRCYQLSHAEQKILRSMF